MATLTSSSWQWNLVGVGVGGSFNNYGCRENFRRRIGAPLGHDSGRIKKGYLGLAAVKGCKWEEVKTTDQAQKIGANGNNNDAHKVSEEDSRFIEEFRDAYPYVFSHRGRTFVVVISAEIVASPRLHALLKVSLS